MPFNGTGTFQALPPPTYPAVASEVIRASYFNAIVNDLISGLTNVIAKDGQTTPSANLPMGGRKHTGAADGTAAGEYYVFGQNFTTAAVDTNNQKPATTAFVLGQLASTVPVQMGTAAAGTSTRMARADHVHPNTVGGLEVGTRRAPVSVKTSSYTLVAGDSAGCVSTTANVLVPSGVFSAGDVVLIFNNSAASITITQGSGVTMYFAGSALTGNRTLLQRGLASLVCVATNTFAITGVV